MTIHINDKYYHSRLVEQVMILSIDFNLFLEDESFSHRNQLLDFLDSVDKSSEIKTLIINNDHPEFSLSKFKNKWNTIYESKDYESNILRVFRTYNQVLLKIKAIQKVVLFVNIKPVNVMLFNLGLAADLRFASSDFFTDNHNYNFVNIPKGGAAFAESSLMYINPVKMLFQSDKVYPAELFNKHIVDEVFNHEEIMERVLTIAKRYSNFEYIEIEAVKASEHNGLKKLDLSLQKENDYLLACIRKRKNPSAQNQDGHISRIK